MSPKDNKRLVERFYADVVSKADYAAMDDLLSGAYVDHNDPTGDRGPDAARRHLEGLRATFPDFTLHVRQVLCDGALVATRVEGTGTHLGEWMGIEPSGRVIRLEGINIDRVEDGRIVEHWGQADTLGMLLQMGLNPFPGPNR